MDSHEGESLLSNPILDEMIIRLKRKEYLTSAQVRTLCSSAKEILGEEQNVHDIPPPVTVVGDIRGQFYDLLELFRIAGDCPSTNFCFLGNYVNKGEHSLECATLILLLKVRFPARITLLRGNNESRRMTQAYGFYDECIKKYGNAEAWLEFMATFDYLPLAASIADGKYFCPHGGLSPVLDTIDDMQTLTRMQEVPPEGPITDILWSDPEERNGWGVSPRGVGYTFGPDITDVWCRTNGNELIVRGHQVAMEGYMWNHPGKCVTVFSSPNFCNRCGNEAAIMLIDENVQQSFLRYSASIDKPDTRAEEWPANSPHYFL